MMFGAALVALLVAMILLIARALAGPTVYDRIVAMNTFGTKTVLFVALLGFFSERPYFLDIAIVYALINFVTTVAILNLVQEAHLE